MTLSEFAGFSTFRLQNLAPDEAAVSAPKPCSENHWLPPSLGIDAPLEPAVPSIEEQQASYEQLSASAREQGFQQGLAEGLDHAHAGVAHLVESLQEQQSQLSTPLQHIDQVILRQLVELATGLAEKIIKQQICHNPNVLLQRVEQSLKVLTDTSMDIQVRMHPDDVQCLRCIDEEQISGLHLIEDISLERGDCCVETATNFVESRLREQISALTEELWRLIEQVPIESPSDDQPQADASPEEPSPLSDGPTEKETQNDEPGP